MKLDEEQNRKNLIQLLTFMLMFSLSRDTGFTLSKLWRLEKINTFKWSNF